MSPFSDVVRSFALRFRAWFSDASNISSSSMSATVTSPFPHAPVFLERDIKERAGTVSAGSARIRHVIIGILPCGRITNQMRDAYAAKSACPSTRA